MSLNSIAIANLAHASMFLGQLSDTVQKNIAKLGSGPTAIEDAAWEAELLENAKALYHLTGKIVEAIQLSNGADHILEEIKKSKK